MNKKGNISDFFVFGLIFLGLIVALSYSRDNIEKNVASGVISPRTMTIEGHDYFFCPRSDGFYVLTHKGNCRACCGKAEK